MTDSQSWRFSVASNTLKTLRGPLHLATKYEFTKIHMRLAEVLQFMWPVTLEQWDARLEWVKSHSQRWEPQLVPWAGKWNSGNILGNKLTVSFDHIADAIELGLDAQIPSIVPGAFYILNVELYADMLASQAIGYNMGRFQGTPLGDASATRTEALLRSLNPNHFVGLMAGRERLDGLSYRLLSEVLPQTTPFYNGCDGIHEDAPVGVGVPQPSPCAPAIAIWWEKRTPRSSVLVFKSRFTYLNPLERLAELGKEAESTSDDGPICLSCLEAIAWACEDLREWLWSELPYLFGLKSRDPAVTYGYKACL